MALDGKGWCRGTSGCLSRGQQSQAVHAAPSLLARCASTGPTSVSIGTLPGRNLGCQGMSVASGTSVHNQSNELLASTSSTAAAFAFNETRSQLILTRTDLSLSGCKTSSTPQACQHLDSGRSLPESVVAGVVSRLLGAVRSERLSERCREPRGRMKTGLASGYLAVFLCSRRICSCS